MVLRSDYNKTTDKEWYLNSNVAYQVLHHYHKLPKPQILFHIFHHILDTMNHEDRIELLRHYFREKEDFEIDLDVESDMVEVVSKIDYETVIKHYFLLRMYKRMLRSDNKIFATISHEKTNQMYVWNGDDKKWKLASVVEREDDPIEKWSHSFNKQDDLLERMNSEGYDKTESEFGFMDILKKTEQDGYGFKLKNVLQKKNNLGAKCSDADKQSILLKMNRFLELTGRSSEKYESDPVLETKGFVISSKKKVLEKYSDGSKKISKKAAAKLNLEPIERVHLCIIFEILMRYHTVKDDVPYIFSLEESNASKATTITVDLKKEGNKKSYVFLKK